MTDPPAFEQLLALSALPAWLPPVLTTLYDGCGGSDSDAAARWGQRVETSLQGLRQTGSGWELPFEVVHDWQARAVVPLMLQACQSAGCDSAAGEPAAGEPAAGDAAADLRQMHARAAAAERFAEAEWRAAIEPALRELYRHAYGYAEAYATARSSALAYAHANDFSESGAIEFADSYATLSTEANRQSFAESNAVAHATVLAAAYASGDGQAYAEAYPFALVHACAQAWANTAGQPEPVAAASAQPVTDQPSGQSAGYLQCRQAAYARLADGLADSLARLDQPAAD